MTTAAATPRTAVGIKPGDIVEVDGVRRVVHTASTDFSSPAAPRVLLRFADGRSARVHAGHQLPVERSP